MMKRDLVSAIDNTANLIYTHIGQELHYINARTFYYVSQKNEAQKHVQTSRIFSYTKNNELETLQVS